MLSMGHYNSSTNVSPFVLAQSLKKLIVLFAMQVWCQPVCIPVEQHIASREMQLPAAKTPAKLSVESPAHHLLCGVLSAG